MFSRIFHIFTVLTLVLATNIMCMCWMQMVAVSDCHAVEEMADCCCSAETQVTDQANTRDVAVLPSVMQVLDIGLVVFVIDDASFLTPHKFLSLIGFERTRLLRSPPDLYLLHATFLI